MEAGAGRKGTGLAWRLPAAGVGVCKRRPFPACLLPTGSSRHHRRRRALPAGVAPLELPQGVQARNVGPQGGGQAPDNARYLPAFQGANATCFSRLARFYAKDVALMFPALAAEEEEAGREAAAGAGAAAGEGGAG